MNQWKKALSVCFAVFLLLTATVAGTLAQESWTAQQYAANTTETLNVKLVQQQRGYDADGNLILEAYQQKTELVPLVGSAQYNGSNFDQYGMPTAEGYVDHIVRVQNTGTAYAYVRVLVAIPTALDEDNALHWNLGNRFMPEGDFGADNTINTAFGDISWQSETTAIVKGMECNIYSFTYAEPLAPGETTKAAAFVGFYLGSAVEIVDGHILLNGEDTGYTEDSVKIYVAAQGVQSYGFASAAAAFEAAEMSTIPWS